MSEIMKPKAAKYLVFLETEGEFEFFNTYDNAKKWLEDCMIVDSMYSQELPQNCGIYRLDTGVQIVVTGKKKDFTSEEWEEETDHMLENGEDIKEMWKHEYIKMS